MSNDGCVRQYGILKPPWLYWFWRIYVPVAYVGVFAMFAVALVRVSTKQDGRLFALLFPVGFPLFLAAVTAILSRYAFPFEYSMFGKRRRTPLPDEPALRTIGGSWGIIGGVRASMPFVTWLLYRGGLGIKISTLGDVFLPWECIDVLELEKGWLSTLYHHWPEVRGPIRLPTFVGRIVSQILPPDKVIVAAQVAKGRRRKA